MARPTKKYCGRHYYDSREEVMVKCGRELKRIIEYPMDRDSFFCPKHGFKYRGKKR